MNQIQAFQSRLRHSVERIVSAIRPYQLQLKQLGIQAELEHAYDWFRFVMIYPNCRYVGIQLGWQAGTYGLECMHVDEHSKQFRTSGYGSPLDSESKQMTSSELKALILRQIRDFATGARFHGGLVGSQR